MIVGDIGGCKELMPVVDILITRGHKITWIVDSKGKAKETLEKAKIAFLADNDEVYASAQPDLVLIGTSATACGTQNLWTDRFKGKCNVVWYEDLYGTGEVVAVRGCIGPDTLITIDEVARDIASKAWIQAHVVVGGKPTYGNTLTTLIPRRAELRESLRFQMKLEHSHDTPIVTYVSMGESTERIWAHLLALGQAFDRGEKVIVRLHPKLKPSFSSLKAHAACCLGNNLLDTSTIDDTTNVILGSDLVVTDYGGDAPYQAALAGIPVIMTMFPDCAEALKTRGYPHGIPPLLYAGACWGARDANDMEVLATGIRKAPLTANARVREMVQPFLPLLNPDAANTIANIVESCFDR